VLVNYRSLFKCKYSFICQGTSTNRQRRSLFGLRVKLYLLLPVLTTQRYKMQSGKYLAQVHNKRTCRPIFTLTLFYAERQAEKLSISTFRIFWSDSATESNLGLPTTRRTFSQVDHAPVWVRLSYFIFICCKHINNFKCIRLLILSYSF